MNCSILDVLILLMGVFVSYETETFSESDISTLNLNARSEFQFLASPRSLDCRLVVGFLPERHPPKRLILSPRMLLFFSKNNRNNIRNNVPSVFRKLKQFSRK